MYFPDLNDIISDYHSQKSRAIENLDFENAEKLQNAQNREIIRRSELQAKHISDCMIEEFNKIIENRKKNLLLIQKKYDSNKNEIEIKFKELFEDAQIQQTTEIKSIESRLQVEINKEKSKPIPKVEDLLQQANKQARLGNIQASKKLKMAADKEATDDIKNRSDELTKQFDSEKEEMMQKHAIEARNLINLKKAELKEIEDDKIKSVEKVENQYKASINALKCKCDVQCGVLSGDPEINKRYSSEIIQNIESLERNYNVANEEQEKMKKSQRLKEDTLFKTMRIINRSNDKSEASEDYLKRTSKIKIDDQNELNQQQTAPNVRYLSKSFFTTQNTDNLF